MGPTRFPYGQGKGFLNNFAYRGTTANLIAVGDATPDVTTGDLFYTNNTASTTITHFDLQDYANRAANYEGKVITVFFLDNSSRLANADRLFLNGTDNLVSRDATSIHGITLMHSRSGWYEMGRHYANRDEVTTFTTNANSSLNIDGVRVVRLNNTGATTNSIIAFSGGQVGQELSLMLVGSNAVRVIEGGNIFIGLTNAVIIGASGVYKFVKFDATTWRTLAISSGGAI